MVKVKALYTHVGIYGTMLAGQEYETSEIHAAELKRNGLVTADIEAAPKVEGAKINVQAKGDENKTTTILTSNDEKMVATDKSKLEDGIKKANAKKK